MMNIDLGITFIAFILSIFWLAMFEGVIKPALAYYGQRLSRLYLPKLINSLDPIMPNYISIHSAEELERIIFDEALQLTKSESEAKDLVSLYERVYSPIENARFIHPN